jgi:hydrogenase expression/formation protein HypC
MCLAVPTRIMHIDGDMAEVELDGVSRLVSLAMVPEAQMGDYVLVHAGYGITVVDEDEAVETLRLFQELAQIQREQVEQTE